MVDVVQLDGNLLERALSTLTALVLSVLLSRGQEHFLATCAADDAFVKSLTCLELLLGQPVL